MIRFYTLLILILCSQVVDAQILPSFGDSRTGTTGLQFLKIAPDARSTALGESIIAQTDNALSAFWNPAGLAKLDEDRFHFMGGHAFYHSDVSIEHLVGVVPLKKQQYLAISMVFLNSGDIPVTTEFQPLGQGQTYRFTDLSVGLSYAKSLTDQFSFGLTAKYIRESAFEIHLNNVLVDLGFQYDVGLGNTRFAVALSNFGSNSKPNGEIEQLQLNGATTTDQFESISPPAVFRLGVASDLVKKEEHLLTTSLQLNHPTDNNETLGIGVEYVWKKMVSLRTGYILGDDEYGLPSLGFGIKTPRRFGDWQLDYGFDNKSKLGSTHKITLGFSLAKKKPKIEDRSNE